MVGAITNLSTVDYPGRTAMVIFMKGCNLKCSYCHNMALARMPETVETIPIERVLRRIRNRKDIIEAVVISGGEPLYASESSDWFLPTNRIFSAAHNLGLKTKLDTNGTHAHRLMMTIGTSSVDYVAMDIKTYPQVMFSRRRGYDAKLWWQILASLDVLEINRSSTFSYEIRTTCHPSYANANIVKAIARLIPDEVPYYLQPYQQIEGDNIPSTSDMSMVSLLAEARKAHKNTYTR